MIFYILIYFDVYGYIWISWHYTSSILTPADEIFSPFIFFIYLYFFYYIDYIISKHQYGLRSGHNKSHHVPHRHGNNAFGFRRHRIQIPNGSSICVFHANPEFHLNGIIGHLHPLWWTYYSSSWWSWGQSQWWPRCLGVGKGPGKTQDTWVLAFSRTYSTCLPCPALT